MEFYQRVLPADGPFTVFAGTTGPEGKLIEPRHYNGLKTHADVAKKVQELSLQPLNIFFAVGSYAGLNRKDPIAKRCFYLDLDGKDFNGFADMAKELGLFLRSTGMPDPSLFVMSGHGLHVYWCLDRDISIEEWLPIAKALKAKCEELGFAADPSATADPARILRAPGTLNRKDTTPLPCQIYSDTGTSYAPEALAAQLVPAPATPLWDGIAPSPKLAGLVSNQDLQTGREREQRTVEEVVDMLKYVHLPDKNARQKWIQVLCAIQDWSHKSDGGFVIFHDWSQGEPGYKSEEDCWATWQSFEPGGGVGIGTLVKLARDAGWAPKPVSVPDAVDEPSFAEQVSVLAGPMPQKVPTMHGSIAANPMLIAAQNAVNASGGIDRFNSQESASIWMANEFVMITDQDSLFFSLTWRQVVSTTNMDFMLTRYMPKNATGVPIQASMMLKRNGVRHVVNTLGFYPGQPLLYTEDNHYYVNLYNDPPDMIVPTQQEADLFADLWDYAFPREEDKEFGQYLLQFYAHVVQKPSVKITSAPLMVSKEQGTGKTTLMYDIPAALVGRRNARKVSNKVLRSQFSDFLADVHFLHFDEVHINGKWDSDDTSNSLKDLVTGDTCEVHPKGMKSYNITNRLFITATSNYEDAMTLPSKSERRWGVYYLTPMRGYDEAQKRAYFKAVHAFLRGPRGAGVLRWIFNQIDISGFDPTQPPPVTSAKTKMINYSQSAEAQIIMDAIEEKTGPFHKDVFTTDELALFLQNETNKTYPGIVVRGLISKAIPDAVCVNQIRQGNNRVRVWAHCNQEKWLSAKPEELRIALKD